MTTNLLGPDPTLLPEESDVLASIANAELGPADVAIRHPTSPLAAFLEDSDPSAVASIESELG